MVAIALDVQLQLAVSQAATLLITIAFLSTQELPYQALKCQSGNCDFRW